MIFSILAFGALVFSVCMKNRKTSLFVQSLDCLFEAIYGLIINALTGAVLSLFSFTRTILFMWKDKLNKKFYILLLIFFESIIITNCIFTWAGPISLLPTIGSLIRTYCLWQSNMTLVRISGMTTGIFYGSYYFYYQSWFMVMGDILLLVISILNIYEKDMKKIEGLTIKVVES